jgi:hypothetical protein
MHNAIREEGKNKVGTQFENHFFEVKLVFISSSSLGFERRGRRFSPFFFMDAARALTDT